MVSQLDDCRDTLERHQLTHPDGRRFYVYGTLDGNLDAQRTTGAGEPAVLHRRFDRLTGSWVLISPRRNTRPGGNLGASGDGPCPLCPGGPELPWPFEVAVFDNRFPSLSVPAPPGGGPLTAASTGRCQVVVYTPHHGHRALTELSERQLIELVAVLRERTAQLWDEGHEYVMAFENRGSAVGATLDHLHGQLYAFGHLPPTIRTKVARHEAHRRDERGCLGCTLVAEEPDRQIVANDTFSVAVPFAPRWPFEVHVRARPHGLGRLADLSDAQLIDLAAALHDVVARYDGLYARPLPYMMGVQESPVAGMADWHLHVEFLPPHRGPDRLKVRASVETVLGVFINDTVPEASAARLASVAIAPWPGRRTAVPQIVDAT